VSISYLDTHLEIDSYSRLKAKLYKRDIAERKIKDNASFFALREKPMNSVRFLRNGE
jgi:hypothetical protein